MSVTTFTTVNGMILSQAKDGVVNHFVPDPLGSVVMVRDTSGNTVYEAEYDPYGNVQSETGTNPSSLGYVGTLGYIKDSATSMYVRARYLLNNLGRWLTKDPLWPNEPGYVYADACPSMWVDPTGKICAGPAPECERLKGTFRGGCIAVACSAKSASDLITWLRGLLKFKFLKPKHGKPQTNANIEKVINEIADGLDANPFSNANDCCKAAANFNQIPGLGDLGGAIIGGGQDNIIHRLIGYICGGLELRVVEKVDFCARNSTNELDCRSCCARTAHLGVLEPNRWHTKCTEQCAKRSWPL